MRPERATQQADLAIALPGGEGEHAVNADGREGKMGAMNTFDSRHTGPASGSGIRRASWISRGREVVVELLQRRCGGGCRMRMRLARGPDRHRHEAPGQLRDGAVDRGGERAVLPGPCVIDVRCHAVDGDQARIQASASYSTFPIRFFARKVTFRRRLPDSRWRRAGYPSDRWR